MTSAGLARWVATAFVAVSLSACSAYTAARDESQGGIQGDGTYVLTDQELSQNCRGLQAWVEGYIDATRKLEYQRSERQLKPARSILSGLSRMSGEAEMDGITRSVCSNYARMIAMNDELRRKQCKPVDFAAALAVPDPRARSLKNSATDSRIWGVEEKSASLYRGHTANAADTIRTCGFTPSQ